MIFEEVYPRKDGLMTMERPFLHPNGLQNMAKNFSNRHPRSSEVTMDIYAKVKYNKPWKLAKVVNAAFSEPQNNTDSEP